jgi:hypothetical protein
VDSKALGVTVKRENRVLQIHGASRFAVIGDLDGRASDTKEAFHFYEPEELVRKVLNPNARKEHLHAYRTEQMIRRIGFCRLFPTLFLALVTGLLVWVSLKAPQAPELVIDRQAQSGKSIENLLFGPLDACGNPRGSKTPRILIAGSGGGTRAALNMASILRGISAGGHGCNIMLLSGVSGSSAALAYYAGHPDLRQQYDENQWNHFENVMASPFIQDALESLPEFRISGLVKMHPTDYAFTGRGNESGVLLGARTGHLLAESFERRFDLKGTATLSSAGNIGLIFNTAVTGVFPRIAWKFDQQDTPQPWRDYVEDCVDPNHLLSLPEYEGACPRPLRSSVVTGGRLILTNLEKETFLRKASDNAPDDRLIQAMFNAPDIPLARAAALSANFPPVFSNAAIDILDGSGHGVGTRFWVTDGGATDNRGVITLLFALDDAVQKHKLLNPNIGSDEWPPILVIVVDASKTGLQYTQNRGISAGLRSKKKIASQLITELVDTINDRMSPKKSNTSSGPSPEQPSNVAVKYLTMPTVFRVGGLGTHWMMPRNVKLSRPASVHLEKRPASEDLEKEEEISTLTLRGCYVRFLIERLYSKGGQPDASEKLDCRLPGSLAKNPTYPSDENANANAKLLEQWIENDAYRILKQWIENDTYLPMCPVWRSIGEYLKFTPYGICGDENQLNSS